MDGGAENPLSDAVDEEGEDVEVDMEVEEERLPALFETVALPGGGLGAVEGLVPDKEEGAIPAPSPIR